MMKSMNEDGPHHIRVCLRGVKLRPPATPDSFIDMLLSHLPLAPPKGLDVPDVAIFVGGSGPKEEDVEEFIEHLRNGTTVVWLPDVGDLLFGKAIGNA